MFPDGEVPDQMPSSNGALEDAAIAYKMFR
jgi:hypothetical protein